MNEILFSTPEINHVPGIWIKEGRNFLRKYVKFPNNRIYCKNLLNNGIVEKTDILDIFNIQEIKEYDSLTYGSSFQ